MLLPKKYLWFLYFLDLFLFFGKGICMVSFILVFGGHLWDVAFFLGLGSFGGFFGDLILWIHWS